MGIKDRVLVVDDDVDARETLSEALAQAGYLVELAADGSEALARLEEWPADVVVSDVEMGGLGGVELARALRERGLSQPVVLITGLDRELAVARGVREAAACLRKPMTLDELIWTIDCALACGRTRRQLPAARAH
jgi:two-component system OmpR family response regulator